MRLQNAAIFLFAAAIACLPCLVIRTGYYITEMGTAFFSVERTLLFTLGFVEAIIYLMLGWSYKNERSNPAFRKTTALLVCADCGVWIVYYAFDFMDRFDSISGMAIDYMLFTVLLVLMGISQMLLGFMIAFGKTSGIRNAALPAAILTAVWALYLFYRQWINHYHFGWNSDRHVLDLAELVILLLPVAVSLWAFALFRSCKKDSGQHSSLIDQL
jgi:hypothetical protein